MAHKEQIEYCTHIRSRFPEKFKNVRVLDVGSLDINGNNRYLFKNYEYIGLDLGEGKNVDIVSRGHLYRDEEKFDFVISTECFEHDEFYKLTFMNCIELLKPQGMLLFTCATTGRREHGTRRTSPKDAPFVGDYYKNLIEEDFTSLTDFDKTFRRYEFSVHKGHKDLMFFGIKQGVKK